MSRLAATFARAARSAQTAGARDLRHGRRSRLCRARAGILRALDRAGADVLEVGVPFSDPLADGPVIQRATERALASGTTLARRARPARRGCAPSLRAPVVIFSYANPILRLGAERFADRAQEAGVDGVLVLDLPIEEAGDFRTMLAARGIDTILLLSPTTTDERLRKAAAARQRLSVCDLAPRRDRRARSRSPTAREEMVRAHPRASATCRWRSGSASPSRSTCAKSASGPTPPSSAAPSSTSLPRLARRTISIRG